MRTLPSAQFCYELKTALKKSLIQIFFKKNKAVLKRC